jgi:hypothetical protein
MLLFERAVFLHVPKTGGTRVRDAVTAAGARFDEYRVDDDVHADLSYCPCPERFKFAFVRHPCDVYGSYWRFKVKEGWDQRNPFDLDCGSDSFATFVRNVLEKEPAWCSRMSADESALPTGASSRRPVRTPRRRPRSRVDGGGRAVRRARLRETPPVNRSRWPDGASAWNPELVEGVRKSEETALERFWYSMDDWADR